MQPAEASSQICVCDDQRLFNLVVCPLCLFSYCVHVLIQVVSVELDHHVRTEEAEGHSRGSLAPCLPPLQPIGGLGWALAGR